MIELENVKSPFRGLRDKTYEIKIGENIVKLKPKLVDIHPFMALKDKPSQEEIQALTNSIVEMLVRANPPEDGINPQENRADLEALVTLHFGQFFQELAVMFGFTTAKDLELAKKKFLENPKI